MLYPFHKRGTILCLLTVALAATSAFAQDKYQLKEAHAVGDVSDNESTLDMNLHMAATADGKELPPMLFGNRQREKYQETILAVDDAGKTTALQRAYSVAHAMETEPGEKPKLTTSSFEGKTVTVRRAGEQVNVTMANGQLSAKERKDLMDALDNAQDEIYPDHEVAVGEEWTVDAKSLARSMGGAEKATVTGKLMEITNYAGHQCAHIKISMDVSGKPAGSPMNMEMKLSGDLYHALDIQRPLSLVASGPITAKGQTKSEGHLINMVGQGTMKMQMMVHWLKIAGTVQPDGVKLPAAP